MSSNFKSVFEGNFDNLFDYKIIFSKKRKTTISFKVENEILIVNSPLLVSKSKIMKFIDEKKYWVLNKIKSSQNKKTLIGNDFVYYLGEKFTFEISESILLKKGGYCEVDRENKKFKISISKNYTDDILQKTIKKWLKEECLKIITERVEFYAKKYNLKYGKISIREQKSLWGSCTYKNDLSFNLNILMFDIGILDYLVAHELAHTIHKNHSEKFWGLVEYMCPDYEIQRYKLKKRKIEELD